MDYRDRIKKFNNSLPKKQAGGKSTFSNIWYTFKDGDNTLRLVGEFIQVRTHYIAPNPKKGDRGLCMPQAFQGQDKLGINVNCSDWDVTTESEKPEKTCAICSLYHVCQKKLDRANKGNLTKEENEFFFKLQTACKPRDQMKWNVIDRDDPYITQTVDGKEVKVLGLKVAQVGTEAWGDISGIYDQLQINLADPEEGIDILVNKSNNGRVQYAAKAVLAKSAAGPITVKQTPLTPEERALELHDLKKICGKQTEQDKVLSALHADLRKLIEDDARANGVSAPAVKTAAPASQPKTMVAGPRPTPIKTAAAAPKASAPVAVSVAADEIPDNVDDVDFSGHLENEENTQQ